MYEENQIRTNNSFNDGLITITKHFKQCLKYITSSDPKKGAIAFGFFSEYSNSGKRQCSQYLLREKSG